MQSNTKKYTDSKLIIYLASNGITDLTKYKLRDELDGKGPYIAVWGYEIDRPPNTILVASNEDDPRIHKRANSIKNPNKYFDDLEFIKFMFPDIEKKYQEYLNS